MPKLFYPFDSTFSPRPVKRTTLSLLIPLLLPAGSLAAPPGDSRYAPLAESMIEMMNAMGSAMSRYGAKGGDDIGSGMGGLPMPDGSTPWPAEWMRPPPGMPDPREMMGGGDPHLNGSWIGMYGELLIVRGTRFRIYTDIEEYRDGELRLDGSRLQLVDPATRSSQPFEYALSEGKLALRGPEGNILLFRKVSEQQKFSPYDTE